MGISLFIQLFSCWWWVHRLCFVPLLHCWDALSGICLPSIWKDSCLRWLLRNGAVGSSCMCIWDLSKYFQIVLKRALLVNWLPDFLFADPSAAPPFFLLFHFCQSVGEQGYLSVTAISSSFSLLWGSSQVSLLPGFISQWPWQPLSLQRPRDLSWGPEHLCSPAPSQERVPLHFSFWKESTYALLGEVVTGLPASLLIPEAVVKSLWLDFPPSGCFIHHHHHPQGTNVSIRLCVGHLAHLI